MKTYYIVERANARNKIEPFSVCDGSQNGWPGHVELINDWEGSGYK